MLKMLYKVGQQVALKRGEWWDIFIEGGHHYGKNYIFTIEEIIEGKYYRFEEIGYDWEDYMIDHERTKEIQELSQQVN